MSPDLARTSLKCFLRSLLVSFPTSTRVTPDLLLLNNLRYLGRFLYSDEYLQKVARDILNLQLVSQNIFVSPLVLKALKRRVEM